MPSADNARLVRSLAKRGYLDVKDRNLMKRTLLVAAVEEMRKYFVLDAVALPRRRRVRVRLYRVTALGRQQL